MAGLLIEPMVSDDNSGHIGVMAGRPCRPDADTKMLWQAVLPGVPFPVCGDPDSPAEVAAESVAAPAESDGAAKPQAESGLSPPALERPAGDFCEAKLTDQQSET